MATILHTPQLAAAIDACTEIIPGLPATQANLKTLLDRLAGSEVTVSYEGPEWLDGGKVMFERCMYKAGKKVPPYINVKIYSPDEWERIKGVRLFQCPCWIAANGFDFTEVGLVACLARAKERATR